MSESAGKPRWGVRAKQPSGETTVPEPGVAGRPASAEGDALGREQPGQYQLLRELGRGRHSVVYVAWDRHMGREVAWKQLVPGAPQDAEARFLREARISGQLEHPGIAPVYEVGRRADGALYCAMRLVRGRTLADAFRSEQGAARLNLLPRFVQLCQTLAFAHGRGVVHRDVRPANVLLGDFGETVLLDWGLAHVRGAPDAAATALGAPAVDDRFDGRQEGDALGSAASYMSPEQALGNVGEIDEQSDVYSLGVVLYELLTGRTPFADQKGVQQILRIARDKAPPVLSVAPDAPRELAFICERALERSKKRRYGSALELVRDLQASRGGARVPGLASTPLRRARDWTVRHAPVALAAVVALLLLAAAGARIVLASRATRRVLAQALLEKAESEARELRWQRAAAYAAAARVDDDTAEARWRAAQPGPLRLDPLFRVELPSGVEALAVSRDGARVAAGLADHSVRVLDARTAQTLQALEGHEGRIAALVFSPDGQVLVSGGDDGRTQVWSVDSGERLLQLPAALRLRGAAFSPDGNLLATAFAEGSILVWSCYDFALAAKLTGHDGPVASVAFSPDGSALVSSGDDGTVRLWSALEGGKPVMRILRGEGHQPLYGAQFAGPSEVVTAGADGTVRFFGLDGAPLARLNLPGGASGLAASAGGAIAVLTADQSALFVDALTRAPVARFEGDDAINAVALSGDGALAASANRDGRLRLWRVSEGAREVRLAGAKDFPGGTALAFAPQGARVAVGDAGGHIALWDVAQARAAQGMDLLQGPVTSLAFSPDAKLLAATAREERGFLFELAHGDRIALDGHGELVQCSAFSPDGTQVATGSADGAVRLFAAPGGQEKRTLSAAGMGPVLAVAFSPDGTLLAAAGEDKVIRLFELATGHLARRLEGSPETVLALAFSPHGRVLASAGGDQAIRTWHIPSGKLRSVWTGHGGHVHALAFAPDGETLASASADGTLRFWDVRTGRQEALFTRAPEARALAFSPDGALLAATAQRPALFIDELGDKLQLLAPPAELSRQLGRAHLVLDGLRLRDDVDALAPARRRKAP